MFSVLSTIYFQMSDDHGGPLDCEGTTCATFDTVDEAHEYITTHSELVDPEICEDNSTDDPYDLEIITDESSMI